MKWLIPLVLMTSSAYGATRLEAPDIQDGDWVISKIVQEADGGFTTAALLENIAPSVECKYPPFEAGAYLSGFALCRTTGGLIAHSTDTVDLPSLSSDVSIAQPRVLGQIEDAFKGYSYIENDRGRTTVVKPDFSRSRATGEVRNLVVELLDQLGHSKGRDKEVRLESHNTEYTDNFDTDPYPSRWVVEIGSAAYDSVELEYDLDNVNETMAKYIANSPGSIEHESQFTSMQIAANSRVGVAACRMQDTSTLDDAYAFWFESNTYVLVVYLAGTRSTLASATGPTTTAGDFYSGRISAAGSAGNNVVINLWWLDHDTPKPSDPGWIGVDGSPNATFTDTGVTRLDDTTHTQCGTAGRGRGTEGQSDTHHDFFKIRAISDRGGVASPPPLRRRMIIAQ